MVANRLLLNRPPSDAEVVAATRGRVRHRRRVIQGREKKGQDTSDCEHIHTVATSALMLLPSECKSLPLEQLKVEIFACNP